ncbi:MAG TPA: lactate racemase domain-containing protein [Candidatus Didemnitutus sp.]|nr:lactate racemase domain-containing protein [Candidatus Didemnitutus sp.]
MAIAPHQAVAPSGQALTLDSVRDLVAHACPPADYRGQKVLVIIPDGTRTAPIGTMFKLLHAQLAPVTAAFDVMIALGTHPPMSDEAINTRVEITAAERAATYRKVRFLNHQWDNPAELRDLGCIPSAEVAALTGGRFAMDVPVHINRHLFEYDHLIIVGPVFPHEVVGFSGGNKYLFPGVAGPGILNFFHWLGAVVTNPMIIGNKWTPVRRVVDRAGAMVPLPKTCFCLVVAGHGELAGAYAGTPEQAWDAASDLSRDLHIDYKDRPFHTVLSCAPPMYDELWVAGKCMYKLEPVVADGGELIIYAPHLHEVSVTHGEHIRKIGYHCRDYFLAQWDKFKDEPWGTLAHSTHVHGIGTYDAATGVEIPRVRVTLATGLSEAQCREINLGYRDWRTIDVESYANREDEGVFLVRKAGERLYHLRHKPLWAGGT